LQSPKVKRKQNQANRKVRVLLLLGTIAACLALIVFLIPPRPSGDNAGKPAKVPGEGNKAPVEGTDSRQTIGSPPAAMPKPPEREIRIAVVLDDTGYSMGDLDPFLKFPGNLTFAVLPHLDHSREASEKIEAAGKEVILHLPMEPLGASDPGPGAINSDQQEGEVRERLEEAFESVPGAVGVNNHMGSKATSDAKTIGFVMKFLKERNKFFLDSKTTSESIVPQVADAYEVRHLDRTVFLDNIVTEEAIQKQFEQGLEVARRRGSAVLIGHVKHPEVLHVLNRMYPGLQTMGFKTVKLSQLLIEEEGKD